MSSLSRRQFVQDSLLASAAFAIGSRAASSLAAQSSSPNEKLACAVIGVNSRGVSHLDGFGPRKDVQVKYIVDVDAKVGNKRADEFEKKHHYRPEVLEDLRKALDDKTIDFVSTATPNHWHAMVSILAMQAGKDVYVEKPVSHNVNEGRSMVETARKYKKICFTGTQSRSNPGMRAAIEYLHAGKLGELKMARGFCYKERDSIGDPVEGRIPTFLNYDLWCGPAPLSPSTRNGNKGPVHYDWHWFWDFGNGDFGNQGVHQADIARWGLNINQLPDTVYSYGGRVGYKDSGETPNTMTSVFDFGDKTIVFEVRGLHKDRKRNNTDVTFYGSKGKLVMTSYQDGYVVDNNGSKTESFSGGDMNFHFDNFIRGIRSRKVEELNADILDGHLSASLCHLGNISCRLGKMLPLAEVKTALSNRKDANENLLETFDRTSEHLKANELDLDKTSMQLGPVLKLNTSTETFVDNAAADAMLTREYRAPFIVPAKDKV
jgi:predicted dehydrogenase